MLTCRPRNTAGLVVALVLTSVSLAAGQTVWDAPLECAPPERADDAVTATSEVARRDASVEADAGAPSLEAVIRERDGRWSAVLTARYPTGKTGVRQFSAASCH